MHKLMTYKSKVEKTHKGLGNLFVFDLVGTKANKLILNIGIAGSGKSAAQKACAKCNKDGMLERDAITRSGLEKIQKELNGFRGTFLIDDLGNVDTSYSLQESMKAAVALTYDHGLSKLNAKTDLEISDFYGSFLSSVQPEVMPQIVNGVSWEAVIRDKSIRYYHLFRVTKPNREPLSVDVKWGESIQDISYSKINTPIHDELRKVFLSQHGLARADEHLTDFLKAICAFDLRKKVTLSDYKVALEITRPMRLENQLLWKNSIAGEKEFLVDHFYMLSEFATYGKVNLEQLASNWFVTLNSLSRILQNVKELYTILPKDLENIHMRELTENILKDAGYL